MRKHKGNLFCFAACCSALKTVDGAEFVARGAVFFLFGNGGEVGQVVVGGHGDEAGPETAEGWVVVEVGVVLGVDVDEIKRMGMRGLRGFNMAEEAAQDGELEGMEEEGERGFERERMGGGVGVVEDERREGVGLCVVVPQRDVGCGDAGEVGV